MQILTMLGAFYSETVKLQVLLHVRMHSHVRVCTCVHVYVHTYLYAHCQSWKSYFLRFHWFKKNSNSDKILEVHDSKYIVHGSKNGLL